MSGTLRPDNVWDVKVQGSTFDGRDFFQSLFSIGQIRDKPLPVRKDHPGLDLKAEIETVLGFQEISLKGLKLTMSKRAGQMTALTARGGVETAGRGALAPLEVGVQQAANEPRRLVARSEDAGQLFRLVGFYPNMQGGRMRLDVNLDGSGAAEKTGVLDVRQFDLLGDPVVYEVLQGPSGRAQRRVQREVLPFDSMQAPFSVGHGQFVMKDADLQGTGARRAGDGEGRFPRASRRARRDIHSAARRQLDRRCVPDSRAAVGRPTRRRRAGNDVSRRPAR